MKTKLYIVTYNQPKELNDWCLKSLFESDFPIDNNVFIINNHSNFFIKEEYSSRVTVLHNVLRPDFSNGHLGQNWNQAIILGFKNLINPDCDYVITVQVDTIFQPDWYSRLQSLMQKYEFVAQGGGDQLQVFSPEHIKKTGLYDETIANIAFHENEYFVRCLIYNHENISITDWAHNRNINSTSNVMIKNTVLGAFRNLEYTPRIREFQYLGDRITMLKYGKPIDWSNLEYMKTFKPQVPIYMYYPFFEKDIIDLEKKGYIL
jgi:hypothetical protein